MSAHLIDGKLHAQRLRAELRQQVAALVASNCVPRLVVVMVGDNPSSQIYVRNKLKACTDVGVEASLVHLPLAISQQELVQHLLNFSADDSVHGILLQLPLPEHLSANEAVSAIDPRKDVDGLHPYNQGLLAQGRPQFTPCTPQGCLQLIQSCATDLSGMQATVIGRSILVGRPMAMLLTNADVTVTLAHSKTRDLKSICQTSDIIVAALGHPNIIKGDFIKPGAIVIDVGINRLADGSLSGDVDFAAAAAVAGYITPVPGGVGPMTIANLLYNTVKAAAGRNL